VTKVHNLTQTNKQCANYFCGMAKAKKKAEVPVVLDEPKEEPVKAIVSKSGYQLAPDKHKVKLMRGSQVVAMAVDKKYAEKLVKQNPNLSIV